MQKPEATLVAGYNKWKNQFERHVKKGEHGITTVSYTHLDVYKRQLGWQRRPCGHRSGHRRQPGLHRRG